MNRTLLFAILAVAAFIAIFNQAALTFHWFFQVWWADVVLHFMGGVLVALIAIWKAFFSGWFRRIKPTPIAFFVVPLVSVLVVALGWEAFEYLNHFPREANYRFDTFEDLLMAVLGMLLVHSYATMRDWRDRIAS
jgi:hypothetical protein